VNYKRSSSHLAVLPDSVQNVRIFPALTETLSVQLQFQNTNFKYIEVGFF